MPTPMFPAELPDQRGQVITALDTLRRGDIRGLRVEAFSDLDRESSALLTDAWSSLDERVRVGVLRKINGVAEERFELQFGRFLRLALRDPSAVVRQLAVSGLWEDTGVELLPLFLDLMQSDESVDVQAEAARSLGTFTAMAAEGALEPIRALDLGEQMIQMVQRKGLSYSLRRGMIEALGSLASDQRVSAIIQAAYESGDDGEMASALFAMGRSHSQRWLPSVMTELDHQEPEIRLEAVRSAGLIGDERAIPLLAEIAASDEAEIKFAAITALGQIGGRPAAAALRRLQEIAQDEQAELFEEAIEEALGSVDLLPMPG